MGGKRSTGSMAANAHEGSRSEYAAVYFFTSLGTASQIPHQEDVGVDLYCTLTERIGQRAWPRYHYTVQVKSTLDAWCFPDPESVRWLIEHPLPLFLCVVNKKQGMLRLYHTFPRYLVWAIGNQPNKLELNPGTGIKGESVQWETGGETFSLSAPILEVPITGIPDEEDFANVRSTLIHWLEADILNLNAISQGLPVYQMPYEYTTNSTPSGGLVLQTGRGTTFSEKYLATMGKSVAWLADAYRAQADPRGMARALMLLRHMYPTGFPLGVSAHFAMSELNGQLLANQRYAYEAIDLLGRVVDERIAKGKVL